MKYSRVMIIIIMFCLSSIKAHGLDIENSGTAVLFSEMSGTVYFEGIPAANATLIRTISLGDSRRDRFSTDEDGRFKLPAITQEGLSPADLLDFGVSQEIIVEFENRRFPLWSAVKRNPNKNSEALGKEIDVECELTGLNQLVRVDGHPIFTPCRWDVMTDVYTPGFPYNRF